MVFGVLSAKMSSPDFKKSSLLAGLALGAIALLTGCINVRTHSTIEPIYMTLDVNLKVQLQQELDNVFDDIDEASETIEEE